MALARPGWWFRSSPVLLIILSGVAASACATGGQSAGVPRRGEGTVAVGVAQAARTDLAREITLTGPVEPIRTVGVNSRAAGTILQVRVMEGDRVRPGTLMAELDARETAAQLARARAVLANAEAASQRSDRMRQEGIVTAAEHEQARAAYAAAKSDVDLWETRLEFSRVESPTGGVVTAKLVEAGSAVSPNQRLFDVADDALMVVRVPMSELDVVHVRPGDSVAVQLDAYPGARLRGTVRRVFPSADPQSRLVPVEVALGPAPPGTAVQQGFLARIHFLLDRRERVVVVPASAVGSGATGAYVYRVDADTLVRQPITTGLTSGGLMEVVEGLRGGEWVVTSGQLSLRAGVAVRVTSRTPAPGDSAGRPVGDLP